MNPDFGDIMKKAQEMQSNMQRIQEQLANITVEGSAGGGMVKVTANCKNQIVKVEIEPEVIDSDDKEMLEDLVAAAVNQALENAQARSQEEMQKAMGPMMGGLNLGGFKLPGF
ncbi:MAG: YbaB/EbfC family nucleoid-associated protein [Calditrichaeota bacterium]|nr:YbaB/EbfC family nucleoid-associated protein [Calditrichota bacterium]MCB0267337.1 YbaB/EbfC family nucleoid-associated protein [Calditrichota bacterium]MCB0286569.1 YbaB/EbfC family nucleoid-associated protein [Calditrichota bacterium]MCB0300417.1 YbaB/EbfC family nucleoid-associated protein [Calditrichota bacterium]MCB9069406.1 YbaB/EbfC family nucleoid-associated protein [Calditrichia bacterium]